MMEMPVPCPTCDRIVELNDTNKCENCGKLYCDDCLEHNMDACENCLNLIDPEEGA
jgi:hypothetical protein